MSLPTIAPTIELGDYLWDMATECRLIAQRWDMIGSGSADFVRSLSQNLFESEVAVAECRLSLALAGRWSYRDDRPELAGNQPTTVLDIAQREREWERMLTKLDVSRMICDTDSAFYSGRLSEAEYVKRIAMLKSILRTVPILDEGV